MDFYVVWLPMVDGHQRKLRKHLGARNTGVFRRYHCTTHALFIIGFIIELKGLARNESKLLLDEVFKLYQELAYLSLQDPDVVSKCAQSLRSGATQLCTA